MHGSRVRERQEEEFAEARGGLAAPFPTPAGVEEGAWQSETSERREGGPLGRGKCMDPLSKLPGSTWPQVPTASLRPMTLRTGLASPLGWSSRSDRPFGYE